MKIIGGLIIFIALLGYIVINHSAVMHEYVCEGETRLKEHTPEPDSGRLKVSDYRWWVDLWASERYGAKTDGMAIFISTRFARFYVSMLQKNGDGNFSDYMNFEPGRQFVFRRATGELAVKQAGLAFTGKCTPASN